VKACVGDCETTPFPGGHGIAIVAGDSNVIEGNHVGTDVTGTQPKPNQGSGVFVSTNSNRIGGTGPGQGNVIGANGATPYYQGGVDLNSVSSNVVEGNHLGTGPTGTEVLGNPGAGILITSVVGADDNFI